MSSETHRETMVRQRRLVDDIIDDSTRCCYAIVLDQRLGTLRPHLWKDGYVFCIKYSKSISKMTKWWPQLMDKALVKTGDEEGDQLQSSTAPLQRLGTILCNTSMNDVPSWIIRQQSPLAYQRNKNYDWSAEHFTMLLMNPLPAMNTRKC